MSKGQDDQDLEDLEDLEDGKDLEDCGGHLEIGRVIVSEWWNAVRAVTAFLLEWGV